MKIKLVTIVALCISAITLNAKPLTSTSTGLLTTTSSPTPVVPAARSITGFEVSEGFATGFLGTQAGWSNFGTSATTIESSNPALGVQHLRIANDPGVAAGTLTGGFSPNIGPQPNTEITSVSVDILISAGGGADYDVIGQAPSLGLLTWRINFNWLGNIFILDDVGAGLAFIDTTVAWPVNTYFNLQVISNPILNSIDYYIDGSLFYSGAAGVYAADTVEQVVILSDNFQFGEVGDFDNLNINTTYVAPAVPVPTLSTLALLLMMLTMFGILYRNQTKENN